MSVKTDTTAASMIVFTVCADAELSALAAQAPLNFPALQCAGAFQEYISASHRPHFPQAMRSALCCIALIDFDRNPVAALETAEMLHRMPSPRITCVGVSSHMEIDLVLKSMRAGCNEFLLKPVNAGDLQATLERIQNRLFSTMESSAARGRVLTVFGAKGGVGTTTLAVHLAAYLTKRHGKKTLLVDHYRQLGHVCLYLGLKENRYHFDELVRNVDRLDAELLQGFLVRHPSGLSVIASPDFCAARQQTSKQDLERIFDFLRKEYDYIVIDSSLQYEEAAAMIQLADGVYLVLTPDVAAVRDLSRHIENQSLSDTAASKLRIVINRSSHDAIDADQIEKVVHLPVSTSIPNNYAELLKAINAGETVPQRRSEFTAALNKWADQVISESADATSVGPQTPRKKFSLWK
jgi:pilus assembly protein CpaE